MATVTHRHGRRVHAHPFAGVHRHLLAPRASRELKDRSPAPAHHHTHHHAGAHGHDHGHSHGLVDPTIVRSRAGLRAVALSLAILGLTAAAQLAVYTVSGSVALLADLIHNFGDALTAVPLAIAFSLRSGRAERGAGLAVVAAIFVSACVVGLEAVERLMHPQPPTHLWVLAGAGAIGFVGNELAAVCRLNAGRRLRSPALIADGRHARVDGLVSLGVVASALLVAAGAPVGDPLVALVITAVILKVTWDSWGTVRHSPGAWDGAPRAAETATDEDQGRAARRRLVRP